MTHKPHPHGKPKPAPARTAVAPAADTGGTDPGQIVERPDGYYWQTPDSQGEFGPFETYELASAGRDAVGDESLDRSEALHQAERDIGINDWIDVETGGPAEGQSPPHFEQE
jgi:hypothetical protein